MSQKMIEELNDVGGIIHYRYGDEIKVRSIMPRSRSEERYYVNVLTTHVTEDGGFLRIERTTEWFDTDKDTDVHCVRNVEYISLSSIIRVKIGQSMGKLGDMSDVCRTRKEE